MVSGGKAGKQPKSDKPVRPLSEEAHKQVMDLLGIADKSTNPDIRAAAVEIAKEDSKYRRQQAARVSPNLILVVIILATLFVGVACWCAFIYKPTIAYELAAVSILLYLTLVGVCLFLPGYLSQANFMKILGWLESHVKGWRKSEPAKEANAAQTKNR